MCFTKYVGDDPALRETWGEVPRSAEPLVDRYGQQHGDQKNAERQRHGGSIVKLAELRELGLLDATIRRWSGMQVGPQR